MTFRTTHLTGFGSWNNITVALPVTYDITDEVLAPNTPVASLAINSNGTGSGTFAASFNWARPNFTGVGNDYEVYFTVTFESGGGTFTGGSSSVDTWLPLSANRGWTLTRSTVGTSIRIALVSIRRIGGQIESEMVVTMTATINNE